MAFIRFLDPENVVIILRDGLEVPLRGKVIFQRWHSYSGKTGRKGGRREGERGLKAGPAAQPGFLALYPSPARRSLV